MDTNQRKPDIAGPDCLLRRIVINFQYLVVILQAPHSSAVQHEPVSFVEMRSTRKGQTSKGNKIQHDLASKFQRAQLALPPQPKIGRQNRKKNRGGVTFAPHLGLGEEGNEVEVDGCLLPRPRRLLPAVLPFPPHLAPSPRCGIGSLAPPPPAAAAPIPFPGVPSRRWQWRVGCRRHAG